MEALREWILAFADDELFTGHRHSEWLGVAPFLEEDLAHASIAQDELGHARALYGVLSDDIDQLAFGRSPHDYRAAHLAELACPAWEDSLARHFFYDLAESVRWRALTESTHPELRGIAAKALREEEYHVRHAIPLVHRMLTGTEESRRRVLGSIESLYPLARALFEPTADERQVLAEGIVGQPATEMESTWQTELAAELARADAGIDLTVAPAGLGARRGERSEHFAELFATMTSVLAIDPNAAW